MGKREYIESEIIKLLHEWIHIVLSFGALAVLSLGLLDYLVTPENFSKFLIYRLGCASVFLVLILFNKLNKKWQRRDIQTGLLMAATIAVSSMVELMILSYGGHQSIYYGGIILIFMYTLGFIPLLSLAKTIMFAVVTFGIYLGPIILFDTITNPHIFLNNTIFVAATGITGILWRHSNDKLLLKKISLEYDLSKDKEQLEIYSNQLEDLVQERTKELSISEKWHRSIFDNATDGIIVLDRSGTIVNVNQKACEIHGFDRDALIGVNINLLEADSEKKKQEETMPRILKGETLIYEAEHYRKDGTKVFLDISSKAIEIGGELYIQSFYRDITEKKQIQEQLMHSQKMESVGSLAGGIAHNFNNILTAILGYSELLLEFSTLDETSKQRVKNIESSARKAGVMVSKLLSFARREAHEVYPLNLNDVINDSVKLFEGVLNKRIGLKVDLYNALPTVEGDPNQLEQVIMNLMVNARDAMPDGGLITVRTDVREIGNISIDIPSDITPGKYIEFSVSDTGCGIPKGILNRIFDPFFTTKEKGKGTGLGLATVYGIVKDHKGYISVQSEEGKGTSFTIYLPVTGKVVRLVTAPQQSVVEGNENILVVDDDRDVLNFIRDILETHGYTVIPANNSLAAVDTFRNLFGKIHLVITDIVMPLMEGDELMRNLREIKPDVKIIVVSGYGSETAEREKMADAFIKKPFESIELLSAVRQLLDADIRRSPLY